MNKTSKQNRFGNVFGRSAGKSLEENLDYAIDWGREHLPDQYKSYLDRPGFRDTLRGYIQSEKRKEFMVYGTAKLNDAVGKVVGVVDAPADLSKLYFGVGYVLSFLAQLVHLPFQVAYNMAALASHRKEGAVKGTLENVVKEGASFVLPLGNTLLKMRSPSEKQLNAYVAREALYKAVESQKGTASDFVEVTGYRRKPLLGGLDSLASQPA